MAIPALSPMVLPAVWPVLLVTRGAGRVASCCTDNGERGRERRGGGEGRGGHRWEEHTSGVEARQSL